MYMTNDTPASAAEKTHVPSSSSTPRKEPPAALAVHSCLKDHYKNLPLEKVVEDLAASVEMTGSRRQVLNRQVYALDALFNAVLIAAPKDLTNLPLLNMALRAQRQCQLTSSSLSIQKKSDKRTDSSYDPVAAFLNAKI